MSDPNVYEPHSIPGLQVCFIGLLSDPSTSHVDIWITQFGAWSRIQVGAVGVSVREEAAAVVVVKRHLFFCFVN